ncbi:uncharacterized protein [Parasteatoda tepidariorum]|uniref:uncharacterized protein isoform X2 n=1 Tax=Parasteatoda tepidariorum TaxID=114398 RepID=UPI001C72185E|nr:uncharacterized protein LOC107453183 isoform X2 [Parasteatoda tepidariorum]
MNPFGTENLFIDGVALNLPIVTGGGSPLSSSLTFQKPGWLPDADVNTCPICDSKFTAFRRKHHCRNCGRIFCSNCCSQKVPLPHFGMPDAEKVCNDCKNLVELLYKLKSDDLMLRQEGVFGLCEIIANASGLCQVIGSGGLHLMFSLALNGDLKIKKAVASVLNTITQRVVLNNFLLESGCLKLIKNFLVSSYDSSEILSDSLSVLNLFCMDSNLRLEVLKEGIVDPLLSLVCTSGTTAVFASRVLQLLVSHFDYHEYLLQNHSNIIKYLFDALLIEDYQMQNCISKILVYLSAGSQAFRDLIIQEEMQKTKPLLFLMKGTCESVLVNAVCIVSNVSISINQDIAHEYVTAMCELLSLVNDYDAELLGQIGRGLANFSECPSNFLCVIHHLPVIISKLLKSNFEIPKMHCCRLINYLLVSETAVVLNVLSHGAIYVQGYDFATHIPHKQFYREDSLSHLSSIHL